MTIFGLRITTERAYRTERADELAKHIDECNQHMRAYQAYERKIEELDMQRHWWRTRFEQREAMPATIRITPHAVHDFATETVIRWVEIEVDRR